MQEVAAVRSESLLPCHAMKGGGDGSVPLLVAPVPVPTFLGK